MDSETAQHLAVIDAKLATIAKILDDGEDDLRRRRDLRRQMRHMRQFVWIIAAAFSIFFAGVGVFVSYNHSSDMDEVRDRLDEDRHMIERFQTDEKLAREQFESDLKERYLGKSANANLALYYPEHNSHVIYLNGAKILVDINKTDQDKNHPWSISFKYIIANEGNSPSGPIREKMLMDLDTGLPNSDMRLPYRYEYNIGAPDLSPAELPGKYSSSYLVNLNLKDKPKFHNTRWLMEFFYGRGEISKATIYLNSK